MDLAEAIEISKMACPENMKERWQHDVLDWLITEVERLNKIVATDNKDWTDMEETLIASRADCEKYKSALDQISKVPDDYPLSAVKRKATAAVGYYRKDNKGRKSK